MALTIQKIAGMVANDIRTYGHFKSNDPDDAPTHYDLDGCCILCNPTMDKLSAVNSNKFVDASYWVGCRDLGIKIALVTGNDPQNFSAPQWSDTTPTAEVLSVLDSIAGMA